MASSLAGLNSAQSTKRLEQIASLRARGIGEHIDLPQLVVCGDQSAGKSSVLEGITGIPFPRQDGVCTKFATEIILQHTEKETEITASIIPSPARQEPARSRLRSYVRRMNDLAELPSVIAEAGVLMGLRGFDSGIDGPAFSEDVLRIEVHGRTGMQLAIVDLPGLISVANEEQTEADVHTVQKLVDSYISNPRTIILAVVQASNDIANQQIIQKARLVDRAGQRTVGIITKADLINEGTEKRIALLAKNLDTTKLKLGYFLLKNPTPTEIAQGITLKQRQENENAFFNSPPWREQRLDSERVGILSLRNYLQVLLDQHIERELPKVRDEMRRLIRNTEKSLLDLGEEISSLGHMRLFLSRLAMRFHSLTGSALDGTYHETDTAFFEEGNGRNLRLRAVVHRLNTSFSDYMRISGAKRKVISGQAVDPMAIWSPFDERTAEEMAADPSDDESHGNEDEDQISVTEAEMKAWIKQVYMNSRGKELPGNYNHVLLTELFHIQSSRWQTIAEEHVEKVYTEISNFVTSAIRYLVHDEHVQGEIAEITEQLLLQNRQKAQDELRRLGKDEKLQQPITYNHYFTDNVQNSRQESMRKQLRTAMEDARIKDWNGKFHFSNNSMDEEKLVKSLQKRIVVDMDEQACSEAFAGLQAYYKVARKTFVDNVCRQVIERHLLRELPDVFSPEKVALFSDEELTRITADSPDVVRKRKELQELLSDLVHSLQDLRK